MSKETKIESVVEELVTPIVNELDLELWDVEYKKEGQNWYLRIFIDKPGGVDLDDCSRVSEKIGKILDEKDPIAKSYFLEVSSPGLERPLKKEKDFTRSIGKRVYIKTFAPQANGKKEFEGELIGITEGKIALIVDGDKLQIPLEQLASARLAVDF